MHNSDQRNTRFDSSDERFLVEVVRDTIKGERRVKNQGELYLPKLTGHLANQYAAFKQRAPFLNVPKNTLDLILGKTFRKDTIFELPSKLQNRFPVVEHARYDYDWLARRMMREVVSVGRIGVLVDPNMSGPPGKNEANLVPLMTEHILSVRKENGVLAEANVTLSDCETDEWWKLWLDADGVYTMQKVNAGGDTLSETFVPALNGQTLRFIPLTIVSPQTVDPVCPVTPPMGDLALKTIYHYALGAEYRHALHLVASPQPFVAGFLGTEVPKVVGPGSIWAAQNPAAKAMIISYNGDGLSEVARALEVAKSEMASMGASMLLPKIAGVQAARALELKDAEESSFSVEVAKHVSDAFGQIIRMQAEWELANPDEVSVKINTDMVSAKMDAATITALHRAVLSGSLSFNSWIENLRRGEVIAADRTADDEKDLIEDESPLPTGQGQ